MIICEFDKTDISELSVLAKKTYTETFGHSFSKEELNNILDEEKSETAFKQFIKNGDNFLVAKIDNKIVGYVGLQKPNIIVKNGKPPSDKDQALKGIYVDTQFHRLGIGKKLMDCAFQHERFKTSENVYLCVWEENKPAYNFYLNYGFKQVGTCDVIVDKKIIGTDTVMMKAVEK